MTSPFTTPSERLTTFFDLSQPRAVAFEDAEIDEIANLLERCGHIGSKFPRTYIVLRSIGELDSLQRLLDEGFNDQWFPVELRGLPSFLQPRIKSKFVEAQNIILTKTLDLENGKHKHFAPGEALPFDILGRLGSGGYGQVDKIVSKTSFRQYALKRIRRRAVFGKDSKEGMKRFKSEIHIVKSLQHRHVIQYVGSYTDKTFVGLVMAPVADLDLAAFLAQTCVYIRAASASTSGSSNLQLRDQALAAEMCSTLRTFFGCMAAALTYLHDRSIRHKDIKPQNILVHQGNPLLTDFGLSRDFADDIGSTTSGLTPASPRYSPPEVAAYESRNTSADVWSLGCVFLEMVAALHGHTVDWIRQYFQANHTQSSHFYANPDASSQLLDDWELAWNPQDRQPLKWIRDMCQIERHSRPTAARVLELITTPDEPELSATTFCGICCVFEDETDSCDSLDDEPTVVPVATQQSTHSSIISETATSGVGSHIVQHDPGPTHSATTSSTRSTTILSAKDRGHAVITSIPGPRGQPPEAAKPPRGESYIIDHLIHSISNEDTSQKEMRRVNSQTDVAENGTYSEIDGTGPDSPPVPPETGETQVRDRNLPSAKSTLEPRSVDGESKDNKHSISVDVKDSQLQTYPSLGPLTERLITGKFPKGSTAFVHVDQQELSSVPAPRPAFFPPPLPPSDKMLPPSPPTNVPLSFSPFLYTAPRSFPRTDKIMPGLASEGPGQIESIDIEPAKDPSAYRTTPDAFLASKPAVASSTPLQEPKNRGTASFDFVGADAMSTVAVVASQTSSNTSSLRDRQSGTLPSKTVRGPTLADYGSPEQQEVHGVFGVSLDICMLYAGVSITHFDKNWIIPDYKVPALVAICGAFLKKSEALHSMKNVFKNPDFREARVKELVTAFDTPLQWGIGLDWTGYTKHDATEVLRRYLVSLPKPLLTPEWVNPLRSVSRPADRIKVYRYFINNLPRENRQLLLYLLHLFKKFESRLSIGSIAKLIAERFLEAFFPSSAVMFEHKMVLVFLIDNQNEFI